MHPDLVRLSAADQHDRRLRELKTAKKKLDEALSNAGEAAEKARAALEKLKAEKKANETRQHELSRSIEKYEARRTSAVRVLEGGGGDPEAAQRQVEGCTAQLDAFETEMLERMEAADALEGRLAAAHEELEAAEALHAQLEESYEPDVAELRSEFESIVPQRDAQLAELDHHTRTKYIGLRDRKGTGVAQIMNDACRACRIVVQQQQIADIKRGLVVPCRGCGRWLVPAE